MLIPWYAKSLQQTAPAKGRKMPRTVKRSKEELEALLSAGDLLLREEYAPGESYPLSRWVFTECKTCHAQAHYRLQYITEKAKIGEPVCRACYWTGWYENCRSLSPSSFCLARWMSQDEVRKQAESNGFELASEPIDLGRGAKAG